MAFKRFHLDNLLLGLVKFILGIALALFVISLAGAATARYFLTQLSTLPERPVYENDAPAKPQETGTKPETSTNAENTAALQSQQSPENQDTKILYQAVVTYGSGLLVRTGAGANYETLDGIDYDETIEVLEESGRWFKVRTSRGVEGWIKGEGNTQRL